MASSITSEYHLRTRGKRGREFCNKSVSRSFSSSSWAKVSISLIIFCFRFPFASWSWIKEGIIYDYWLSLYAFKMIWSLYYESSIYWVKRKGWFFLLTYTHVIIIIIRHICLMWIWLIYLSFFLINNCIYVCPVFIFHQYFRIFIHKRQIST